MKEITRITLAEITQVALVDDKLAEKMEMDMESYPAQVADALRHEADADDVHVSAKLFIREVDK